MLTTDELEAMIEPHGAAAAIDENSVIFSDSRSDPLS
jgi:hypothetical protein